MGRTVTATTSRVFSAPPRQVFAALGDYEDTRRRILTEQFSEYEVREGGQGAGTIVRWKLAATKKRVRDCLLSVSTPAEHTLQERDANSSMVTTWTVSPEGEGGSAVRVETTWNGAGGIGGFFERTFAPGGLERIYIDLLNNLDAALGDPKV